MKTIERVFKHLNKVELKSEKIELANYDFKEYTFY